MDRVVERAAGLDVHTKTVAACVRVPTETGERTQHVQTFDTTTIGLLALRDWLTSHGVTHVAMESTGVYWKPVYYLLEDAFTCVLVNAAHIKQVPGRKTDVLDCAWIAQLLEHGLLRGSFVPPPPLRDLRDLTRYRQTLLEDRTRQVNRLHKVLQEAGIKLASVASDVLGVSGRAMLEALAGGTTDPTALADLARGRLRAKRPALQEALRGRFRVHHAQLLSHLLAHIDYLDDSVAALSGAIEEQIRPFAEAIRRLDQVPGLNQRTLERVLAEIGVDMTVFPTAGHLASWSGLCPGNDESAGKRRSGRTRKGNRALRGALIQAAWAATRAEGSPFAARYRRLRHRGHKKAVVAVAHALLRVIYHMLASGTHYRDVGADYFDRRHVERAARRAIRVLEGQGYRVVLQPAA
jgi:transposase